MTLYLIDGTSFVYRSFYAIRGLTDSRGRPTNAIFGFTNMLLKIIREKKPGAIAVSFDSPQPTERHLLFDAYKAHRPEAPDDLRAQIPHIKRMVEALRMRSFILPGYEADDILATIAEKASGQGADVFIVTGDKDMLQLVGERIKVYDPIKDLILDEKYVIERFGVPPSRVIEYMALVGDAADNIPGVKGIGEKTAKELLAMFNSLEDMASHTERIPKERLRRMIAENEEAMWLSKKLAEIDRSVPLEFDLSEMSVMEPDWQSAMSLFKEFEFSSFMKLIPGGPPPERRYETVTDTERLDEIVSGLPEGFAFSVEASSKGNVIGIAVCGEKDKAVYVPLAHEIEKKEALKRLRPYLESETAAKTAHDMKRTVLLLRKEAVEVGGELYDTMLASYLLNPLRADHSIENSALEHLSRRKKTLIEVAGKKGLESVPIEEASLYACDNAELALELKDVLFERLRTAGMSSVYFDIEMPLIGVLADIEEAGIGFDTELLSRLSSELEGELEALKKRIYFLAGMEFNINSPKQLGKVLFETLGLKPGKRKKTGYSTEGGVLEELAREHELPGEILSWRTLSKLKGTYVDALPLLVNPETKRLHTSFNQTATATGRLSSSEPNLQNIPVRGDWGRRIREAFTADEGNIIIGADYSQVELRVLAHLSGDDRLRDAFEQDMDVHSATAAEIFGVSPADVTTEMRRVAKTVNFGVVYGITPFGLSETLGVSKDDAGKFIKQYFERHPKIKGYIEESIREAKATGYVKTISGRMRPLPELSSPNAITRQFGERLAVNSPIQGTAADIIKIAMIRISESLRANYGADPRAPRMILQVHDELVFECPEAEKDRAIGIVKYGMESAWPIVDGKPAPLSVPLKVEVGWGRNWAEAGH